MSDDDHLLGLPWWGWLLLSALFAAIAIAALPLAAR